MMVTTKNNMNDNQAIQPVGQRCKACLHKLIKLQMILVTILPAAVLLLLGACSISYFVPAAGTRSEDRYAIIRTDSLLITIRPQSYPVSYQELNNRFFPVFVRIKNNASLKTRLSSGSFGILMQGKQYDPIPLDLLLLNLRSHSQLNSFQDPFLFDNDQYLSDANKEQEMFYDVIANAFSYGDILPGGLKEGYLFYDRSITTADSFSIDVLGNKIVFIKQ